MRALSAGIPTLLACLLAPPAPAQVRDEAPRFEGGVELVAVDVNVVDPAGNPVPDLAADDFTVEVDGGRRRVVSARFVEVARARPAAAGEAAPPAPGPPAAREEGRRLLIVFDRGELHAGAVRNAAQAARKLLDALQPDDRAAVVSIPSGPRVDFTADRAALEKALDSIGPFQDETYSEFNIGLAEAVRFVRSPSNGLTLRECEFYVRLARDRAIEACEARVAAEARRKVENHQRGVEDRLNALEALCRAMVAVPGRKVVVLVSGGFTSVLSMGGRDVAPRLRRIADAAAAAQVTFYSLYLSQRHEPAGLRARESFTGEDDRRIREEGLEALTGMAGGTQFEAVAGADFAFARVANETSGYYLLGLEPEKGDRDGKPHAISVKVARKGVEVRARRRFVMAPAQPPRKVRAAAPAPPSPVRVATHVLRGPAEGQMKVVLAAEVEGFRDGALGLEVVDPRGAVVGRLDRDLAAGEGSPPRQHDTLLLDRGPYTLRAEATDGGGKRVRAEQPLNAELLHGVGFDASDLMLFEQGQKGMRLSAGGPIGSALMPVYLELYLHHELPTEGLAVKVEVIAADGTRRAGTVLSLRNGPEAGLLYAEGAVDLWSVPPGAYVARAVISFGPRVARRIERGFEYKGAPRAEAPRP